MTLRAAFGPSRLPGRWPVRRSAAADLSGGTGGQGRRQGRATLAGLALLGLAVTAAAPATITVRPGDTLWDLARTHRTSVAELQRLNGLAGSGLIYAGQTLRVPGTDPAAPTRDYTVARGDTVSELAQRFGTSVAAIVQANGLATSGFIRIGQTLSIPGTPASPALAPETTNAGVRIPDSVRRSVAAHRTTLASRPMPSRDAVRAFVAATARKHGVDPSLAVAVAYQESGFQQGVVSPVDAIGVMQVLPSTGAAVSAAFGRRLDLLDWRDNITAGVVLLKQLRAATGDDAAALAGYYQGLGSVAANGRLPQTDRYIQNVSVLRPRFTR